METRTGVYVDGAWLASTSSSSFSVINPYTEKEFGAATIGSADDVERAVRSARRALTSGEWPTTSLEDRIGMAERIKELLIERADELVTVTSQSMGIPRESYRTLGSSAELIDMYIDQVRQVRFEYLRMDATGDSLIVRRPVGVVAAIVPWNVPIRSEVKKIIPAILAGCTVVIKPAPETPFGAASFVEMCSEAGVPPGVVNLVLGDGSTGEHLIRHPLVDKVAFTGSSGTGSRIWSTVSERFTRLQLELGGKSAAVVLDDADLSTVTPWLSMGIFNFTGQQCTATSRILAPRTRYQDVVESVVEAARSYVLGDPLDVATTMGPLVAERQRTRVLEFINAGTGEGAKAAIGGGRPNHLPHGYFVEPTVLTNVDNTMRIAREEIFGPVVCIIPHDSDDDAISIANDSDYGLGGAVFSADPDRALAVARRVDSGYVSVNRYGIPLSAPFGGIKRSGIGREHGVEGYDSFLEYVPHPLTHEHASELAKTTPLG